MKKIVSLLLTAILLVGALSITASADGATWSEGGYGVIIASSVRYYYGPSTTGYDPVPGTTLTYGDTFSQHWESQIGLDGKSWISTGNGWLLLDGNVATYYTILDFYSGKVTNVSSNLAVRKGPTTNAPSIGSLQNNTAVSILAKTHYQINGHYWYMISYGSGSGWVASEYIVEA